MALAPTSNAARSSMALAPTCKLPVAAGGSLKLRSTPRVAGRGSSTVVCSIAPDQKAVPGDVISYVKTLPGISDPFPQIFDPLNFLGNAAGKRDGVQEVKRWRESELTHGRVAMLASLGFIAQEQILGNKAPRPFPHVNGPAIDHFQQVETQGAVFWLPLLVAIGLAETWRVSVGWKNPNKGGFQQLEDNYKPGDLGFDPLGLYPEDSNERYQLETKELNNGRLAMIAIAAFVVQELKTHQPIFAGLNLAGTSGTNLPKL